MNHRLVVAGLGGSTVEFTPAALDALYEGSAGVPRVINRLCDRALARAYAAQTRRIDPQFIADAIDDLGYPRSSPNRAADEKPATEPLIVAPRASNAVAIAAVKLDADSPLMEEFRSEADLQLSGAIATDASATRRQWATVALVSMLIVLGSVGVPAWYVRMHKADADAIVGKADAVVVAPQPPPPAGQISPNVVGPTGTVADQASPPTRHPPPPASQRRLNKATTRFWSPHLRIMNGRSGLSRSWRMPGIKRARWNMTGGRRAADSCRSMLDSMILSTTVSVTCSSFAACPAMVTRDSWGDGRGVIVCPEPNSPTHQFDSWLSEDERRIGLRGAASRRQHRECGRGDQDRDRVAQTPVRVSRAALAPTYVEEFQQVGLHVGSHLVWNG